MSDKKYRMAFTTGSLYIHETVTVAELYQQLDSWDAVRARVYDENLLQARTMRTLKNIYTEIVRRLKTLGPDEMDFLIDCSPLDRGYLLWLAFCRHYVFAGDFAVEVLRERYLGLKKDISYEDYDCFFNGKSQVHSALDTIREVTRKKLRQVLFRVMRESGLIDQNNSIRAALMSPHFIKKILIHRAEEIRYFPVFESDLGGCIHERR